MKTQLMIFALFGILITSVGSTPVFGENESVIVTTDKSSYLEGEIISISGEIKYIALGNQLSIIIQAPNGNLVSVDQISPESNGDFALDITVGGPLWSQDGMYTVVAQQGSGSAFTDSVEVDVADGLVVPEFGTIAAMILAVAIISIIAISAKSRLSIVPRY